MSERSPKRVEEALVQDLMNNRDTPLVRKVLKANQVIKHNFRKELRKSFECALNGCTSTFEITIFPNQIIYPKFCEKHRSEYQRELWLQQEKNDE